jgi:hypothetical protein
MGRQVRDWESQETDQNTKISVCLRGKVWPYRIRWALFATPTFLVKIGVFCSQKPFTASNDRRC